MRMIHNIFPIPVMVDQLRYDLSQSEIDFINTRPMIRNLGNSITLEDNILDQTPLDTFKSVIQARVDLYFKKIYAGRDDCRLIITRSWINHSLPGENHHLHDHPNSFVSGVMYLQAGINMHSIRFQRRLQHQLIQLESVGTTPWNRSDYDITVNTGDIVLFPSSLEHCVPTVPGDETRVSLSFNTFPVGILYSSINSKMGIEISDVK